MTIGVRADIYGNEATATFPNDAVEDAVAHLVANPTFQVLPPDQPCRLYGDIEGNAGKDVSEEEFNKKNEATISAITAFFAKCNRRFALTTASSFEMTRWSFHLYCPDAYVKSVAHAKYFASEMYELLDLPEGINGDLKVYNPWQKFRECDTPTAKGQVRPFKLVQGEWKDTLINYIPDTAELIDFAVPIETRTAGSVVKVEDAELTPLLDCVASSSWQDYTVCRNMVWAMCSCGASPDLIHAYCSKAPNYERKWVDDLIRNHKADRSPTISYLRKFARLGNPSRYMGLVFADTTDPKPYIEEMMRLTEDEHTQIDTGRYLMKLPDVDTLAVKCMMGCGKTVEMKRKIAEMVKKNPAVRILVLSGRRTWSDHIHAELKADGFVHYEKYKAEQYKATGKKVTVIDAPRLILQMSPASMKLIDGQTYDVMMVDECETVLTMMSFLSIHKNVNDWLAMGQIFEKLIRDTKRVLFMDAFLNDRTMDLLRELRPVVHLVINTTQPYDKQCIQYTNKSQFYTAVANKIRGQQKRGVHIWGTVKAGNEFQPYLEAGKVPSVFYHANCDAKVKANDMDDVNASWAKYRSVGYTGTITVGINYTNKDAPFDFLSLYATPWGGVARDFIQALHRSREVTDNVVLAHIDTTPGKQAGFEAGMDAQEKLWSAERSVRRLIVEKLGENPTEYSTLPEWWKRVIMRNRNEQVVNAKFFEVLMPTYMGLCGIKFNVIAGPAEKKKAGGGSQLISVADVRDIDADEAEWLHNNRRGLSEEDHYALEKFALSQKVVKVDQKIWELWNNDQGVVRNAFNVIHRTPTDLFRNQDHKVLDLVNKNIAKMEVIQGSGLDWTQSWTKPVSELPDINLHSFTLRDRSEKEDAGQHWRNVAKAFNRFGIHLVITGKQVRRNGVRSYDYEVSFFRDTSAIAYIAPKVDLATVFQEEN
jgi:hypothetical protein